MLIKFFFKKLKDIFKVYLKFYKSKFIENLSMGYKIKNTLLEYANNYHTILNKVKNNFQRTNIYLMRQQFQKLIKLNKVFSTLMKIKQNFKILKLNKFDEIEDYDPFYLNICFYRWKYYIIKKILEKIKKNLGITILFDLINIRKNNSFDDFFMKMKLLQKNKKFYKDEKGKIKKTFFNKLDRIYKWHLKINFFTFISNLKLQKEINTNVRLKLVIIYKKIFANIISAIKNKFDKWKKITYVKNNYLQINYPKEKKIIKLNSIIQKQNFKNLKYFFIKIRTKTSKRPHISMNQIKKIKKIDLLIIENQSKITIDYENDEKKLLKEIIMNRFFLFNTDKILKCVYRDEAKKLMTHFQKWKNICYNIPPKYNSYDSIINDSENIRVENEQIVNEYRERKLNYKRTVEDYEEVQKNFCENCLEENHFVVDYKSINNMGEEEEEIEDLNEGFGTSSVMSESNN
jgi:hypothetical protein